MSAPILQASARGPFPGIYRVQFAYNAKIVEFLRTPFMIGCLWDSDLKEWRVPEECLPALFEVAEALGYAISKQENAKEPRTCENEVLHPYQRDAAERAASLGYFAFNFEMGLGKGLLPSTVIATPFGWQKLMDLEVGDFVIGKNGKSTRIIGYYPQGRKKVFRIIFSDGSSTICDDSHLWAVQHNNDTLRCPEDWRVMSTQALIDWGLQSKRNYNWRIPMVDPVQYQKRDFVLDPYTLGAFLGDGSSTSRSMRITTDEWILDKIGGEQTRHPGRNCIEACIKGRTKELAALRLKGLRSWEKFIPQEYMFGSVEQRLALLQGLMDTDGSPHKDGGSEFSSTSEALIDGVVELAQSFGGVAKKSKSRKTFFTYKGVKKQGRISWRVNVKLPPQFDLFTLPRKLNKWIRPTKYPPIRIIRDIEFLGQEKTICIKVDEPDSLFVIENYIVTHNTSTAIEALKLRRAKRILIVCPAMVRNVWAEELEKWWPERGLPRVVRSVGRQNYKNTHDFDTVIASYETLGAVTISNWDAIVCDESHLIKEARTKRGQRLLELAEKNPQAMRFTLTGTPLAQEPKDLWAQLNFLRPGSFSSWWKFTEIFCNAEETKYGRQVTGAKNETILRARIAAFSNRVTQKEMQHLLPSIAWNTEEFEAQEDLNNAAESRKLVFTFRKATAHALGAALGRKVITGEMTQKKRVETIRRAVIEEEPLIATMDSVGIGIDLTPFTSCAVVEISPKLSTLRQALGRIVRLSSKAKEVQITFLSLKRSKEAMLSIKLVEKMEEIAKVMEAGVTDDVLAASLAKADQDFAKLAADAGLNFTEVDEYGL